MENKFWVAVMRACPMHLWHQAVIEQMIKYHKWNCMIILWGRWHEFDARHIFDFEERRRIIWQKYDNIHIDGVRDCGSNDERLANLDKVIWNIYDGDLWNVLYRGWCPEDVIYFTENNRQTKTLDRFDGSTPVISATQVRARLADWLDLDGYIDTELQEYIRNLYQNKFTL